MNDFQFNRAVIAAIEAASGTVKAHLHSGQTIEGTASRDDDVVTITEVGGTVWTVHVGNIAAFADVA